MTWSERLSSLDATFLHLEDRTRHMHVGGLVLFSGPPPRYDEVLALIQARLHQVPRYRQRLAFVPLGRPVWVDETQFDLEYHVRHTALPAPGDEAQLKRLAGRLFSQQLDRKKPLWELWFVEGLDRGRFAIISKTHHCMVDGLSGMDIATVLMDTTREPRAVAPAAPWQPRPAPSTPQLIAEALRDQLLDPLQMARDVLAGSTEAQQFVREIAGGIKPLLGLAQLGQAPASSLNVAIGPHRRFETVSLDLAEVRRIKAILGGTVNDVVLAIVTGALRILLRERGEALPEQGLRSMVPVSVRAAATRGKPGNQVTAMFANLPVALRDPVERLDRIRNEMRGLKESHQAVGAMVLTRLGDFAPPTLMAQGARLGSATRFFNLLVTNVPGPQTPLYFLGREMQACYPLVPLAAAQTIVVGLLSYHGRIDVGLVGDADAARDLPVLAAALPSALAELSVAADLRAAPAAQA